MGRFTLRQRRPLHLLPARREDRQTHRRRLVSHAINSVRIAAAGKDGISYLTNNISVGIRTSLTSGYEAEILKQTKTHSLQEALVVARTR